MNVQALAVRPKTATWSRLLAFVVLTVIAMIASSKMAIHLPYTPVPITGQVFVVMLSGLLLGAGATVAQAGFFVAISSYGMTAASGTTGTAAMLGPTGGYIVAFPFAVIAIGMISERSKSWFAMCMACLAGLAVIYMLGGGWLAIQTHSIQKAYVLGIAPFVYPDLAKIALAVAIAYPCRSSVRRWLEGGTNG